MESSESPSERCLPASSRAARATASAPLSVSTARTTTATPKPPQLAAQRLPAMRAEQPRARARLLASELRETASWRADPAAGKDTILVPNAAGVRSISATMKPSEFEWFCAGQLRKAGWDAAVTLRSRDQGVDVVAQKSGVRVALQCNLYSTPVGNKAFQEFAAGRAHEQAHYRVVVTNNRYTAPAEQLASTNGILLLH
jgi:hypothetical protein